MKTSDERYDVAVWAKNLGNVRAMTTQSLSSNLALGGVSFAEPLTVSIRDIAALAAYISGPRAME